MRRVLSFLLGAAGVAAGARLLRRRGRGAPTGVGADPAEELRAKLEESRGIAEDRAELEAGETPVDAVEDVAPQSLEERRRRVHDRAQEAIESMRLPPDE